MSFVLKRKWFMLCLVLLLVMAVVPGAAAQEADEGEDTEATHCWHPCYPPPPPPPGPIYYAPTATNTPAPTSTPTAAPTNTPTSVPPTATFTPAPVEPQACQVVDIIFDKIQYTVGDTINVTTRLADANGTPLGGAQVTAVVETEVEAQAPTGFGFVDRIGEYDGVYTATDLPGAYVFNISATDPTGSTFAPCSGQEVVLVVGAEEPTATPTSTPVDPTPTSVPVDPTPTSVPVDPTPTSTPDTVVTPTPTITNTPVVTVTPVTPTPTITNTPVVTVTPVTPTPTITNTPVVTATPTPTNTPVPEPQGAVLTFSPLNLNTGEQLTQTVVVENFSAFNAYDLEITYNPSVAQIASVEAGPAFAGSGTVLPPTNGFDNTTGQLFFDAAVLGTVITGDATLLTITWNGVGNGTSALTFNDPAVLNGGVELTDYTVVNGSVTVGDTIQGQVGLQGRTNHSGILVTSDLGDQTQTDASGAFTVNGAEALWFTAPSYLSAKASMAEMSNQETTMLLAGDTNGDDAINIMDLSYIAINYQGTEAGADLNGDGSVNIQDLALAAGNYAQVGALAK